MKKKIRRNQIKYFLMNTADDNILIRKGIINYINGDVVDVVLDDEHMFSGSLMFGIPVNGLFNSYEDASYALEEFLKNKKE